jgi:hypothetical protein
MSRGRSCGIAALVLASGLTLAGCGGAAEGADVTVPPVAKVVSQGKDVPGLISLADAAARRLDIRTTPVAAGPAGLVVPYGAIVYEPDGSSWVFVQTDRLTYQRAPVTIGGIAGDQATLVSGPEAGTQVVTLGAAELVGVETGIDGEE